MVDRQDASPNLDQPIGLALDARGERLRRHYDDLDEPAQAELRAVLAILEKELTLLEALRSRARAN